MQQHVRHLVAAIFTVSSWQTTDPGLIGGDPPLVPYYSNFSSETMQPASPMAQASL